MGKWAWTDPSQLTLAAQVLCARVDGQPDGDDTVCFSGPGDCHIVARVSDETMNLTIRWLDHAIANQIIELLLKHKKEAAE